jgi:hypothetical protein
MLDYQNGKIYTIRYKNDSSLIYVGSTCLPLWMRFVIHKSVCYNPNDKSYNHKFYAKIRETDDLCNWYIELYENFPCENKTQLVARENVIMREISTLNKLQGETIYTRKPCKTFDEIKSKASYLWKQNNHEKNKDYIKIYNEENKQRIKEIGEQRITCDCGTVVRKDQLKRHKNTLIHTKKLSKLSEEDINRIKETQEQEKNIIKKPKEKIQCEKDEIHKISSKLEAINAEDLAKILIEAKKTSLLDF